MVCPNSYLPNAALSLANSLNQYTQRSVPGTELCRGVAQSSEVFTYDADGNMTGDGRFRYTWNAENRMAKKVNSRRVAGPQSHGEVDAPASNSPFSILNSTFVIYDHKGRMVRKDVALASNPSFPILHSTFVWDGWNIIRENTTEPPAFQLSNLQTFKLSTDYVWGLDLDGTLQGAGGVGGLLAVVRDDGTYLPTYDANGNISEYVDAADGTIAAHYEYSPFGELLIEDGELAGSFTHRFSTKPYCPITKLCEYQMRKYKPEIGRWLSRDPIEEEGGKNLHSFIGNASLIRIDNLGMATCEKCCNADICHWTGNISGNVIIPVYVGAWANISINATGISEESPNCFWSISGSGRSFIPGGGLAVGWIKGTVSIDIDAPCEWPTEEIEEGMISWIGAGGTAGIPVNFTWTVGVVGKLHGEDWFGIGGINVFLGGGGFRASLKIKQGKGCFR